MRSIRRPGVPTTMSTPLLQRARSAGSKPTRRRRRRCTVRPRDLAERARAPRSPGWRAHGWGRARGPSGGAGSALPTRSSEREAEGEGLAGAGLGLAADVAAGEGVGDGERLDGERSRRCRRAREHRRGRPRGRAPRRWDSWRKCSLSSLSTHLLSEHPPAHGSWRWVEPRGFPYSAARLQTTTSGES